MIINKRYKVIRKISQTHNNVIYLVSDEEEGKLRVLKLLKNTAPEAITQFKKEFLILHSLSHPNIVTVYESGSFSLDKTRRFYFTMEYIEGIPFNHFFIRKGYEKFLSLFLDAVSTLSFIHKKGYLHCDLKPNHLLIDKDGVLKLVDFGFAQFKESITKDEIGGTLLYIAPEILRGEKPDVRTDIYSMGVIAYESITGKKVYRAKMTAKILANVLNKNFLPLEGVPQGVPEYMRDVIARMTDKQRLNRYSSFDEIKTIIQKKGKLKKGKGYIERVLYSDFIGREQYIRNIEKLKAQIVDSGGRILLIEGTPGIGKTRLLKEIEYRLFIKGNDVQYLRITRRGSFNFTWLLELLEKIGVLSADLRKTTKNRFTDKERYRFFENILRIILKSKKGKGSVFLLDDVNLEDSRMNDFILYLSNFLESSPFLFILATEDIPDRLQKIIEGVYGNIKILKLEGLKKDDYLLFVKNMLGVTGNVETLSDYLFKYTDGNPYFTEEILRDIARRKMLKKEGNNLIYDVARLKRLPVPESMDLFVKQSIKKLSDQEREILKLVAIFGDSISLPHIIRLSPYNETETLSLWEGSQLKHFFTPSGDGRFDFTHKIVRKVIYKSLKEDEKLDIHKRILAFLESQKETLYTLHLKAYHSFVVKAPDAVLYLKRVLKRALEYSNGDEAIDAFEKLKKLEKKDIYSIGDKGLLLKVGNFYYHKGRFDEAINLYNKMLKRRMKAINRVDILHNLALTKMVVFHNKDAEKLFGDLLKEELTMDRRFEILTDLGWFYYTQKEYDRAEKTYNNALTLLKKGSLDNRMLAGKLYYNLSVLYQQKGELEKAESYARYEFELGERGKNSFHRAAGLNMLAMLEQYRRRYDRAIDYYRKALKFLQKTEDLPRRLHVLSNLARLLFSYGDIETSRRFYSEAVSEAKKLGNLYEISLQYNLYGRILLREGDWKEGLDLLRRSYRIAGSIDEPVIQLNGLFETAIIYAYQGRKWEYRKTLDTISKLQARIKDKRELLQTGLIQGFWSYVRKDYRGALASIEGIVKTIDRFTMPEYQIPALILKSRSLKEMGRIEEASLTIALARRLMEGYRMFVFSEEIGFVEVLIRIPGSSYREVIKQFDKLLGITRENERFLYAEMLRTLSDVHYRAFLKNQEAEDLNNAISLLEDARQIFTYLGATPYILDVDERLVRCYGLLRRRSAEQSKEKTKNQEIIKEFCKLVRHISNPEQLKQSFISMAKSVTGAERGLFITFDRDTDELMVTGNDIDRATVFDAKEFSRNVINRVKRTKKPLIVYDAVNDEKFKDYESVRINKLRSILCIPVVSNDVVLGTLYLDSRSSSKLFSEQEERFFSSLSMLLADSLSSALDYRRIKNETNMLRYNLRTRFGPKNLIGRSEIMQSVFDRIERFAKTDVPVLILGETGTGKELTARSIHFLSKRKDKNFLVVDCSSISQSLLESELFGYKRGAFTGAVGEKMGMFEAADGGTLFIDEIAAASHSLQARFLRFLDTQEVKKIGATRYKKVDTRIIVASNKDLYKLSKTGRFIEDLFFRLSRFILKLPALRERKEDIRPLLDYYIDYFNKKYFKNIKGVTPEVFELLYEYNWPGNVREFVNEISRCVFFCEGETITKEYLSEGISRSKPHFLTLSRMKQRAINQYIKQVLSFTNGNVTKAARILGVDKKTIYRNVMGKKY